ncbi:hypothetical protein EN45_052500 [Penicillium chrysogenum]|jgi:hypothetical protein|uniref:Uncharacterized protein n=1 Tax=Penicillium chrysogenum TaxID=5076 RepID=A0A167S2K0_PENCH|nr:hypothetical protein EN45_052500 [Penicillium chrysogenum]
MDTDQIPEAASETLNPSLLLHDQAYLSDFLNKGYMEDLSTTDSWNPPQNSAAEPETSRDKTPAVIPAVRAQPMSSSPARGGRPLIRTPKDIRQLLEPSRIHQQKDYSARLHVYGNSGIQRRS